MRCKCGGVVRVRIAFDFTREQYQKWLHEGGNVEQWVAEPTAIILTCEHGCLETGVAWSDVEGESSDAELS